IDVFSLDITKYKLQRFAILISQEKLPLKAVCLLRKYVDRRFSFGFMVAPVALKGLAFDSE
ncbi:hypothetical protein, partial [Paenibacillus sp. DMB20]|uniref:hypothetical protein n=1 Tax=Paenibacillus sp. DMB20 TaxID=1642570 RepID=UPI0006274BFE